VSIARPARREWIVAIGLLALCEVEILVDPAHDHRLAMALVAGAAALSTAWRVVAPLQVFAVIATLYLGAVAADVPVVEALSAGAAVTGVGAYSIGAHLEGRRARWAPLLTMGAILVVTAVHEIAAPGDLIFPPIIFGYLPWLAGRTMRRRRLLVAQLAETARQLEAEREDRARAAVLDERVRIARELHDLVAHSVSTMVVQAGAARRQVREHPADARSAALAIEGTGREALNELRGLLGVLRRGDEELALAPQPTLQRVGALVEGARAAGIEVDLRVEGDPAPLPRGEELAAYRIVQEALTNVLQHAGDARAQVVVRYLPDRLEITVEDDGHGANGDASGAGHGLVGMRERVALYGGSLDTGRSPNGGWAVHARLPRAEVVV
jgi:signal transduction histidine kinase